MSLQAKVFLAILMASASVCLTFMREGQRRGYKSTLNLGFDADMQAYPQPLPSEKPRMFIDSYPSFHQGERRPHDKLVYKQTMRQSAHDVGQQVIAKGDFQCILSYLSVDTNISLPILLRGGVGYNHFTIVIRAKAQNQLEGKVYAYCRGSPPSDSSSDG